MEVTMQGRGIAKGSGYGDLLVSEAPISFLSGVDPTTGIIIEQGHPLQGRSIAGTVFAFPHGKGSTVGSYILYALARNNKAPVAIINQEAEPIIAIGAIISGIPMVDRLDMPFLDLKEHHTARVNGETGEVKFDD
jgi:uncharacterized protein